MSPSRSVLVTHADTTLGERLVRSLIERPWVDQVLAVTSRPPEQVFPLSHPDKLRVLQVDLHRPRRVRELLFGPARELYVDTVIHTPAHHSPYEGGRRLHALNVQSTRELLQLAERHPTIERFVYRSGVEVYQVQADLPVLIEEDHPLNLGRGAPQWVRDRVEADLTVCTRMGLSPLRILVLRFAECLAPGTGSQLYDWLSSPICLVPLGYNPMVNVITLEDSVRALELAMDCPAQGVFNVPGLDTLPLLQLVQRWGRVPVAVPPSLLAPIYHLRQRLTGSEFRFGMNRRRFLYSALLDGTRARELMGYEPRVGVEWPAGPPDGA